MRTIINMVITMDKVHLKIVKSSTKRWKRERGRREPRYNVTIITTNCPSISRARDISTCVINLSSDCLVDSDMFYDEHRPRHKITATSKYCELVTEAASSRETGH